MHGQKNIKLMDFMLQSIKTTLTDKEYKKADRNMYGYKLYLILSTSVHNSNR